MNLSWIDWSIVVVFIVFLLALAIYTKQFNKSVVDFLAANRCAGRYLLSITRGASAVGAISFIGWFEMYYNSGFSGLWWLYMFTPLSLMIAMCGFVQYRYRESRVLTMAQLFEIRYSRKFRVFSGMLMWLAGIVNMGIYPAVTARLFIYFCGLPAAFTLFGIDGISTFVTIMLIELSIALLFTFLGGMIVVIITDFFQGIFCNIVFLIILVFLMMKFDWDQIVSSLSTAAEGASMFNPYNTAKAEGFNIAFYMMHMFAIIYGYMAWQGAQGYNAAAKNPHEAKMSGVIGGWRLVIQYVLVVMLPVCAFVFMNHSDFASQAREVQTIVSSIDGDTLQKQMLVPVALAKILPIGLMGLFVAVLLAAAISTDDTYLHSWGSIFVQDVIMPFRKKKFTPKQHLWVLRFSIIFVALFIFFFSLLYKQNDYVLMFFAMTGAVYLGGAGSVIIGGLYWKRGTTAAAWTAMIVGGTLAVGGMLLRSFWSDIVPVLHGWLPDSKFLADHVTEFPLNGMQISFIASVCAIVSYVGISLFEWLMLRKPAFNINRMLHRGQYAIKGEHTGGVTLPPTGLKALLPTKEFSGTDRILFWVMFCWSGFWSLFTVGVTFYHFVWGTTEEWWQSYWYYYLWFHVVLGTGTTIWFLFGGLSNIKDLFRTLRIAERNSVDDGRVTGHHSIVDEELEKDNPEVMTELKADVGSDSDSGE